MTQVNTPTTFDVGRVHAEAELRFRLVASTQASFTYGKFSKASSEGIPATGTVPVDGLGNHVIDLITEQGDVEFTVESPDGHLIEFKSDEDSAGAYRWTFVGDPNWSGGHINEEATEIAKLAVEGKPLPSKPATGDIPEKAKPAMGSEITRPWAPDKDSGPSVPRKGVNPVEDDAPGESDPAKR